MQGAGSVEIRDAVVARGAPGLVCSPFLRITSQAPNLAWLRQQVCHSPGVPLSVQLMGNHAEHLALAACILGDAGANVIDLNLGCPARLAVSKGSGSALLSELGTISRIVSAMRQRCRVPLSVKIRAGNGTFQDVLAISKAIEAAGADILVLHPRTRWQGYAGVANWDLVRHVRARLSIKVVGNGDLWYASDALELMRTTGADAVMLGRPALRNPFIFQQIAALHVGASPLVPTGNDIVDYVEVLADIMSRKLVSLRRPGGALKEQIQYLLRSVPEPVRETLSHRALRAESIAEIVEAIRPLRELPVLDLAPSGPFRFETTPSLSRSDGNAPDPSQSAPADPQTHAEPTQ